MNDWAKQVINGQIKLENSQKTHFGMVLVNAVPNPFLRWFSSYRTMTESEFDLDRVNGDPFEEADDPFGVLAGLQSQLPLRLCIMSLMC